MKIYFYIDILNKIKVYIEKNIKNIFIKLF